MSNPMPGWYPDPEDSARQRFWDGNQWTEARAYPAVGVGPEGGVAEVEAEKETARSWRAVALIALLVAVLLGAAYYFLLRGSGESTPEPLPTVTAPTDVPTLPTQIPTPSVPTPTVPSEAPSVAR